MKFAITIFTFIFLTFFLTGCNNNNNSTQNNTEFSKLSSNSNNKIYTETEIAYFSTPLKSGVQNRITNIKITSDKINEYILKKGETFSFNEIVGPCTSEEGYKEAEIYVNKQIKYALGGGNCQVSTTLYNAVLSVERINNNRKT